MRISPGMFGTFVSILTCLVLPTQIHAQDDTNASLITDPVVWGQMHQVMGGVSNKIPSGAAGPAGIYVITMLSAAITHATAAVSKDPKLNPDDALKNYFGLLLDNKAVSGLLLLAPWSDLNPCPANSRNRVEPHCASSPYAWHYLDDAFDAINAWNNDHPHSPPKTLQLGVPPGFNSPPWLFGLLTSCDGLFMNPPVAVSSSCGYTTIFYRTESNPHVQMPLPLPWNPTYKNAWNEFLVALNNHIQSRPTYISDFVSIGVGGPTASSTEIILPNGNTNAADTNENANPLTLPNVPSSNSATVTVYQAWNCLLGNNYGVPGNCLSEGYDATTSSYLNSDRAFVEEWAAAIDMYGQIFSGVTLTVATGQGLPQFSVPSDGSSPLLSPPPAFTPDCSAAPTMDCAAETAILAYFAEPPVGGANAKAIVEAGLTARGLNGHLSASSVKWLSKTTSGGLTAMPGVVPGTQPVASRMLGGLQFKAPFSNNPATEGCLTDPSTCTPPSPEQALLNVLTGYFAGTPAASVFGASTAMNGSAPVANAPINYLQIWDTDFLYADGLAGCTTSGSSGWAQLMSKPAPKKLSSLSCYAAPTSPVILNGKSMSAQDLLNLASEQILGTTAEYVFLSPLCCKLQYVWRNAFQGDYVCVTPDEQAQAAADNAAAASHYSINYTESVPSGTKSVPYGVCLGEGYGWRQAYMGDYVCVSSTQQTQVATDNSSLPNRTQICLTTRPPCPGGPTSCR